MRAHIGEFRLVAMCRVLGVHRSGYYAWVRQAASLREREDQRLLGLIKHFWLASGGVYGHRKITLDLREAGETCSRHRVQRLMKAEGLRAQVGYGSKPRHRGGPVGAVDNVLNRDFAPDAPNKVWVTDITYIRTYEGWLFLAAVMDLYSRQIVGWATAPTMTSDLVLQALVAAAWRRKPGPGVMVHSDQGSQGGFNQSSQHLNQGGVQWDDPKDGWWSGQGGHRCAHPAALKSTNGRSNRPSGDASRRGCRVKTQHGPVEFHNP